MFIIFKSLLLIVSTVKKIPNFPETSHFVVNPIFMLMHLQIQVKIDKHISLVPNCKMEQMLIKIDRKSVV